MFNFIENSTNVPFYTLLCKGTQSGVLLLVTVFVVLLKETFVTSRVKNEAQSSLHTPTELKNITNPKIQIHRYKHRNAKAHTFAQCVKIEAQGIILQRRV